eukprot:CAMPEP_0201940372 /NCGR_PEP_ID=MMETSP0903-20130614/45114_1 /ASSEMBLY_ACC=CAM_ASM_000552 /TAXON_ID=420261 /ORGANISM="Thalassiosira antarctica, Strain CCMP982" /LENGTH=465 /DNA_ID=CAMNT_0048482171 /DNA_START=179 /DNA_END=1579 /DNA_ORIENTATION=-
MSQGSIVSNMCGSSWYLSLNYLRLGNFRVARNLMLNGGFLQEAYYQPLHVMVGVSNLGMCNGHSPSLAQKLPRYHATNQASLNPDTMQVFLKKAMPADYQRMMNFASQTAHGPVREYVDLISSDWQENSRSSKTKTSSSNNGQGKDLVMICIVVLDEDTKEEVKVQIGHSTTLKSLFNDYAQVRDLSLRSLRFSFEGRTLFLSSAKNKTPEQLGMNDLAIITVTDLTQTSEEEESSATAAGSSHISYSKNSSSRSKKGKRSKKKKAPAPPVQPSVTEKTQEELKIEHSNILTKIHEEAQPQFKQIRQRLNNLSIERSRPKVKSRRPKFVPPLLKTYFPHSTGLGGKAGKSHYVVQVGEVQNLYKTSKPRRGIQASATSPRAFSIDLHGLTKAEASDLLNEKLPQWNDSAMSGSYPFVMPIEIICGCGNQILSEAVEQWIKINEKVSNAPKNIWVTQRHNPYQYAA